MKIIVVIFFKWFVILIIILFVYVLVYDGKIGKLMVFYYRKVYVREIEEVLLKYVVFILVVIIFIFGVLLFRNFKRFKYL